MQATDSRETVVVFSSDLGWMALVSAGGATSQLTFGHRSAAAAVAALGRDRKDVVIAGARAQGLCRRLRAYAAGRRDDFADVSIDLGALSPFQRRVVAACRAIPYGETRSYGELAAAAGAPRAARAVGNCMARNRLPLVVPCHRVVAAGGRLGNYSAPGGPALKRRLLEMESGRKRLRQ